MYGRLADIQKTKQFLIEHVKKLKELIQKIKNFPIPFRKLSANKATNYSLWKATKLSKRPQQPIPPIRNTK